jgi:hypothetical protein
MKAKFKLMLMGVGALVHSDDSGTRRTFHAFATKVNCTISR